MQRFFGGMAGGVVAVLLLLLLGFTRTTIEEFFEGGIRASSIKHLYGGSKTITDMTIGDSAATSITLTTADTGTAVVALPVNSVSLGAEVSGFAQEVAFCGQLVDGSSSPATTYLGPGLLGLNGTPTDYILGGTACDGLDSTTEATADNPLSTLAVKVTGLRCKQSAASGSGKTTTYTLRTGAADAATTDGSATVLSCSIAGATATECRTVAGTTTNIAASATVAVKALTDADLSAQDGRCVALVAWP